MKPFHWVGIAIPMFLIFVVSWIPQINGPHLWFGFPSLFVWFCLISGPGVSLTLWWFESRRDEADDAADLEEVQG